MTLAPLRSTCYFTFYKGREGKGREGKGREGKGREGKGRDGNLLMDWGKS
jgi:hypothetical protein